MYEANINYGKSHLPPNRVCYKTICGWIIFFIGEVCLGPIISLITSSSVF